MSGPTRRAFLRAGLAAGAGAALWPLVPAAVREAAAMGEADPRFTITPLRAPGLPDVAPEVIRPLLEQVQRRTSVVVASGAPAPIGPEASDLFLHPFLYLRGDRAMKPFPEKARERLRRFLLFGGFLLVDDAEGRSGAGFDAAVRAELHAILPDLAPVRVPRDHTVYKSFFLIDRPAGRVATPDYLEMIEHDDRALVVLSRHDLGGAWARDSIDYVNACVPGGETQREAAYRLGVNLAMYALCLDYKDDQVHVPFIMKNRKWRGDE
ncbi:MAG TPA: DUF4159 domain-containing protein [Myxococcota bacterium]|jgi:hypothetical protein|nr:DUF4159 domain-containing protein [Myxococcota bacterium]